MRVMVKILEQTMESSSAVTRLGNRGTQSPSSGAEFRPDIQGMRALAVGIVVLDHGRIAGFSGGFVGVDVFFVISGFLITGLLLNDIAKYSRVRFTKFYSRRAQRILPAATVTIALTSVASVLILGVIQARAVLVDSVWAVFFGANIHFASVGTDYFAVSTGTSPLLHYWSLSVEEQFYLVWPALIGLVAVLFVKKDVTGHVPRLQISLALLVVSIGSFWLAVVQTSSNPTGAYFSTFDRTWELALGALLAVSSPALKRIPGALRATLAWAGLVSIAVATMVFTTSTAIPSYPTLLPVLGAGAILVGGLGAPRGGAHRLLSLRPLRFLGDISYSLYLWHWPLLILGAAYWGTHDTFVVRCSLIIASVVVAAASYYGLENPMRHTKVLSVASWRGLLLWPVALGVVVSIAIVAAPDVPFAGATGATNPSLSPTLAIAQAVSAALSDAPVPHATDPSLLSANADHVTLGACSQYPKFTGHLCQLGDPAGTHTLVLFGNSHSVMWEPALAAIAKSAHWKFYAVVREACGYDGYVGLSGKLPNACTTFYAWAKKMVPGLHADLLVIGSYTATTLWRQGETAVIDQFRSETRRLVLLSDVPWTPHSPATCLVAAGANQGTCMTTEPASRIAGHAAPATIARATHVQYLDVANLLCDQWRCPAVIDGLIPTYDGIHLTPQYSAFIAPALGPALNLAGTRTVPITAVAIPSS